MWLNGKNLKLTKIRCACGCKKYIGKVLDTSKQYWVPGHKDDTGQRTWLNHIKINTKSSTDYHNKKDE